MKKSEIIELTPAYNNDIGNDIAVGAKMPGTTPGGPVYNPGPAFPAPGGVPLPVK